MRDFNFPTETSEANTSPADIAYQRPVVVDELPEAVIVDEPIREEVFADDSSMRPFHAEQLDEEEESNLPKYLGAAAVVAILAIGGGIYAYESSTPAPTAVAMKNTVPAKVATNQPVAPVTPPAALPQENTAPAVPVPAPTPAPVKSAAATPAAPEVAPVQQAAAKPMTPGVGIGPTDDAAIDAPMTFTADNAPPPQQAGSSSQVAQAAPAASTGATPAPADQAAANPAPANQTTAMQQPVAAPNVGDGSQPTSSVAQLPQRQLQPSIQPAQ